MIILQFLPVLLYSYWVVRRAARSSATAYQRAPLEATASGGAWTALDERQLTRLLKNSAP